ncbi:MAG: tripartite tricarboxylate transporter substrate binding protein, partial [Burkholderiales bacterium]|nr:tripartite tricarboxylate transporter substrate binding protein [Burkholderiales bacterium]
MTILKGILAGLVAVLFFAATVSIAQEYPGKPVRLIVTFPPGGGADMLARAVGKQRGERWGPSVVIEYRGGGEGAIGAAAAARTAPDGYTLLMIISTHTVLPHLKKALQYDVVQDFAPIIRMAEAPNIVVAHPSLPARNIPELVALARKNPGKLDYPGSGYGGPAHLAGVLCDQFAGTKLNFL